MPSIYQLVLSLIISSRSTGITSRGRIGIDASLKALPLVNPWLTDPNDKAVLVQGINDLLSNMGIGIQSV
jgi:hypothetical protein